MARQQITVTIPSPVVKRLDRLAKKNGLTRSRQVQTCLERSLPDLELIAKSSSSPITEAILDELLKPENLERAARIAGQSAEDPTLFRQEAELLNRSVALQQNARRKGAAK